MSKDRDAGYTNAELRHQLQVSLGCNRAQYLGNPASSSASAPAARTYVSGLAPRIEELRHSRTTSGGDGLDGATIPGGESAARAPQPTPANSPFRIVPSPSPGSTDSRLVASTAISAADVWAVGSTDITTPLAEQWNGSTWTVVPTPNHRRHRPRQLHGDERGLQHRPLDDRDQRRGSVHRALERQLAAIRARVR